MFYRRKKHQTPYLPPQTGETMEITGVTAEQDVKVYKPGNGTTTSDSKVQTIDITQAAQPTGIDKADCTTSKQNNGQITGVDTTMEYKLSTGSGWTTINANPLMGLTDGTYEVRVKASGNGSCFHRCNCHNRRTHLRSTG